MLGSSVGTAGDVNGDGYSDVLIGAPYYNNGQVDEGRAFLYYGNNGPCIPTKPQQLRNDLSGPIAPLGRAEGGLFRMAFTGRTPFGRGDVKIEWQMAPLGYFHSGLRYWAASGWADSGTSGASLDQQVLIPYEAPYVWRMRTKYSAVTAPFQGHGPWLTLAANGLRETDLRRAPPCDPPDEPCWLYSVTKVDTDYTLNWQDPNQSDQRTGWNIRRSNDAAPPKSTWPLVGTNVVDMDQSAPNYQWTDHSGADPGPGGVWYFQVTTYNANCPAEGPF
jgi:hypothetical protein